MDVNALGAQFLLPELPQDDDCLIKPLVDDMAFNDAIATALDTIGTDGSDVAQNRAAKQFILIHNWWLGMQGSKYVGGTGFGTGFVINPAAAYFLDGPRRVPDPGQTGESTGGTKPLIEILKKKARNGVDVRVMGWMQFGITSNMDIARVSADHMGAVNSGTLRSIDTLRNEGEIGNKAITNEIAHPAGSGHVKLMIVGSSTNATAFTGGIDFVGDRFSMPFHLPYLDTLNKQHSQNWHDVAVQINGVAVLRCYQWFSTIWQEVISRPIRTYKYIISDGPQKGPRTVISHGTGANGTPAMPPFPVGTFPPTGGHHRVQSLRTAPQFNFGDAVKVINPPPSLSFAPGGLQEFQKCLKKAIGAAQEYIYLEDQNIWSQEVMTYIHDALVDTARPNLKVILLSGGADPNDKKQPQGYQTRALNRGLINGQLTPESPLSPLNASQLARVRFYLRLTENPIGTGQITSVANVGAVRRLTLGPTFTAPGGTTPQPLLPLSFGGEQAVDQILQDELAGNYSAHVQIGNDVFPITANPAITQGGPIVMDLLPNAFDMVQANPPAVGPCQLVFNRGLLVHAKIVLIDDRFAIVGSANTAMRRSLYTDIEHSIAFVDPSDTGTTIRDLRISVWSDHFRNGGSVEFGDIQKGLNAWNKQWGTPGTLSRPAHLRHRDLPLTGLYAGPPLSDDDIALYDAANDADSRPTWGTVGMIRRLQGAPGSGSGSGS